MPAQVLVERLCHVEFKLRVHIASEVKLASVLPKSSQTQLETLSSRSLSNTPLLSTLSICNARLVFINFCKSSGAYFHIDYSNCLSTFFLLNNRLDVVKIVLLPLIENELAG